MMTWIRVAMVGVSVAITVVAHLIVTSVRQRPDGRSQMALCGFFTAVRSYGILLGVNLVLNLITGGSTWWSFAVFCAGGIWLLIALVDILLLLRGHA